MATLSQPSHAGTRGSQSAVGAQELHDKYFPAVLVGRHHLQTLNTEKATSSRTINRRYHRATSRFNNGIRSCSLVHSPISLGIRASSPSSLTASCTLPALRGTRRRCPIFYEGNARLTGGHPPWRPWTMRTEGSHRPRCQAFFP